MPGEEAGAPVFFPAAGREGAVANVRRLTLHGQGRSSPTGDSIVPRGSESRFPGPPPPPRCLSVAQEPRAWGRLKREAAGAEQVFPGRGWQEAVQALRPSPPISLLGQT